MDYFDRNNGISSANIYTINTDGFDVFFSSKYFYCNNLVMDHSNIINIWSLFIRINKVKKSIES